MQKAKRYPNNGFVDSWGQLTPLGASELKRFYDSYRNPMAFLKSKHRRQANTILEQIERGMYTIEDFNESVWVEAAKGIRMYNPDAGADLMTYLCYRIRSVASKVIHEAITRVHTVSFDRPICTGEDDAMDRLTEELAVTDDHDRAVEPWGKFTSRMANLSPIQKTVLEERYMHGRVLNDIARDIGRSRERVRQIEVEALTILQGLPKDRTDHELESRRRQHRRRQARFRDQYGPTCVAGCNRRPARVNGMCARCWKEHHTAAKQDN